MAPFARAQRHRPVRDHDPRGSRRAAELRRIDTRQDVHRHVHQAR